MTTLHVSSENIVRTKWFLSKRVKWSEIQQIHGVRLTKATYDENFLILYTNTGGVDVGELDNNFCDFERVLLGAIPEFPPDWRALLELTEPNAHTLFWTRNGSRVKVT